MLQALPGFLLLVVPLEGHDEEEDPQVDLGEDRVGDRRILEVLEGKFLVVVEATCDDGDENETMGCHRGEGGRKSNPSIHAHDDDHGDVCDRAHWQQWREPRVWPILDS